MKISKLTSLYKPGFVWERERGEERTTEQRGEETPTEQGEGCVGRAEDLHVWLFIAVVEAVKLHCPGTVMVVTACRECWEWTRVTIQWRTATSGTCWGKLWEQHIREVLRWRSSGTREDSNVRDLLVEAAGAASKGISRWRSSSGRDDSNVRDLLVCSLGAFNWIRNFYAKERR